MPAEMRAADLFEIADFLVANERPQWAEWIEALAREHAARERARLADRRVARQVAELRGCRP